VGDEFDTLIRLMATMEEYQEHDNVDCFEKISEAAKELTDVVEVTQAQEQELSVVDILLATHRTIQALLEEVTAIKAHLGRLEPSLTKKEVLESGDEGSDVPKSKKRKQGNREGNETEGE
jgi:hypothetical protein